MARVSRAPAQFIRLNSGHLCSAYSTDEREMRGEGEEVGGVGGRGAGGLGGLADGEVCFSPKNAISI